VGIIRFSASPSSGFKKAAAWGWGFSSVVERLPSKRKALGSVPSSEKKKKQTNKQTSKQAADSSWNERKKKGKRSLE